MKTSAISNPVNITSGAASATKSSTAPVDMPFSQVLSREMAPPPKAPEPARPSSAESSKGAQPPKSDAKPDSAKSAEGSDANAAEQQKASTTTTTQSKTADKADATEGGKPKDQTGDKGQEDDAPVLSAASAELLALVSNLTQPAAETKPVKGIGSAADDKKVDDKQAGVEAVAQEAGQLPGLPVTAQADVQLSDPTAAAQAAGQALLPSVAAQRPGLQRGQADTALAAGTTTSPARRGVAIGKGMPTQGAEKAAAQGVTQEMAQHVNKRAEPDAAVKGNTSDLKEFDAKLAQAKDAKTESGDTPLKVAADRTGLPEVQPESGMTTAKTAQDLQQPGAAMPNIAPLPGISHAQMQPATPAAPANAADMLAPPVGGKGWDQALGQKIVWMVGGEQQSASLTLNPPDLGPLHVVLNVSKGEATASFTAAQPEVRHALETAMPKLREMLGEAGIQLGQANVNAGTPNNQQNAFEQPQPSSRQNTAAAGNENIDTPMRVVRSQTIVSGQGLVDTFA